MNHGEQWKAVPGYEGIYSISSEGRVRSETRKETTKSRAGKVFERRRNGRILSQSSDPHGYPTVQLSRAGNTTEFRVHALMGRVFLGARFGYRDHVHHRDGNPNNNHLSNLEVLPARAHKAMHTKYGEDHPMAKLSEKQVRIVQAAFSRENPPRGLAMRFAEAYDMAPCTIRQIAYGRLWAKTQRERLQKNIAICERRARECA